METDQSLEIAPYNPSGWQILVKTLLGLIIGIFIAFLIFITLILLGGIIQQAIDNKISGNTTINPLLPLILVVIAFVGTFIGTILVAGFYNLLYTDKYYDMGKMFKLTLMINVIIFILFLPMYLLFAANVDQLFFVLAFHVIFAVFVSLAAIEMSTNPNYSAVHLIGVTGGLTLSLLIFAGFYKSVITSAQASVVRILLALPPVLAYFLIPFIHSIWEKLYYKLYTMGNNFFYIPSLNEVLVDEDQLDDISVETDTGM